MEKGSRVNLPVVENQHCFVGNSAVRRLDGLFEASPEPPIYLPWCIHLDYNVMPTLVDENVRPKSLAVPFCQRRHHMEVGIQGEIDGPLMTPYEMNSRCHLRYQEPNSLQLCASSLLLDLRAIGRERPCQSSSGSSL